ncbi:MAG: hypothetical protein LBC61_00765 [Candidatus Peribacteria bacterium]|nr:hypothetical protein [Candidatus Peribacteria bacterium]
MVSNEEFKKEVSKNLASKSFTNDPQLGEFKKTWDNVNNYTFSKENEIISSLEKNNEEKFNLVKDIINTEILKNQKLKEDFKGMFENGTKKVALTDDSSIDLYNSQLQKYNDVTINNLSKLLNYDETKSEESELKSI